MTLLIQDMGGLTEPRSSSPSENPQNGGRRHWRTKLAAHRDEINDRLGRSEERLMDVQGIVAEVKAENTQQTKLLPSVVTEGDEWHEADVLFRQEIIGRVGKIETDQVALTTSAERLSWIGYASYGIGRSARFVFNGLCRADLWKLFALLFLLYILHLFSPFLYEYVLKLAGK